MNKKGAVISVCCCDGPEDCNEPCTYVAVDNLGTLEWVFVPNAPDPECEGECGCLEPDIAPECEGQIAGCICLRLSQSDDPETPNCTYTLCGPPPEE